MRCFCQNHQLNYHPSKLILCQMRLLSVFDYKITLKNSANFFQSLWRISSNVNGLSQSHLTLGFHAIIGPHNASYTISLYGRPSSCQPIYNQASISHADRRSRTVESLKIETFLQCRTRRQLLAASFRKFIANSSILHHPDGTLTPTRALHGSTNAAHHLQFSLRESLPTDLNQV